MPPPVHFVHVVPQGKPDRRSLELELSASRSHAARVTHQKLRAEKQPGTSGKRLANAPLPIFFDPEAPEPSDAGSGNENKVKDGSREVAISRNARLELLRRLHWPPERPGSPNTLNMTLKSTGMSLPVDNPRSFQICELGVLNA